MDKQYIKNVIQTILNKTFKENARRTILSFDERYNFCCPVCLDSTKTASKKRGNVYFDSLLYICYRCGHTSSFHKLCKDYSIQLDPDKKMEMIEYLKSNINKKDIKSDLSEVSLGDLIPLSSLEEKINQGGATVLTEFKPVEKYSSVWKALLERGIEENLHNNIYQAKYWLNEDRYEPVMVFLNKREDKILGLQTRNLKRGKYRSFKIFNFETLYRWNNSLSEEDEIEDIDVNNLLTYNKLSYFINILNINFDSTITIFEGYLDSLFFPNSIGVVGVNTDMSLLENSGADIQYFYDNDIAGYKKAEEKIKSGFKVFLWKKLFEMIVENKRSKDPYTLMYKISQVKDLNKLAELVKNPYYKLSLNDFFSKDVLDIKWLPKPFYKKYKKY